MKIRKNLIISAAVIAVIISAAQAGFALNGLSVQLGLGYNHDGFNMADMLAINGSPLPEPFYSNSALKQIIASERNLEFMEGDKIRGLEINGSTMGINASLGLRLDFFNFLFIRVDGEFEMAAMAHEMRWEWNNPTMDVTKPSDGTESYQRVDYEFMAVPVYIGLNIPIKTKGKGNYNLYLGGGPVWTSGEVSIELRHPSNVYMNTTGFFSPEFKDELDTSIDSFGLGWVIGMNSEIVKDLFVFIEYRNMSHSSVISEFHADEFALMTVTGDGDISTLIDMSSGIIRIGLLYNIVSFSGR